ncbi:hypothetical protein AAVH_34582, partial [Aphelenchoides avenae]
MSEIPQGSNFGIKPFPRPNWGVQRSRSFLGSPAFYAVDYEEPFRGPLARVSSALGNVAEPDPRIPQRQGPYQPPFPLYPSWYSRNYFPCQPHKDYSLVGASQSTQKHKKDAFRPTLTAGTTTTTRSIGRITTSQRQYDDSTQKRTTTTIDRWTSASTRTTFTTGSSATTLTTTPLDRRGRTNSSTWT